MKLNKPLISGFLLSFLAHIGITIGSIAYSLKDYDLVSITIQSPTTITLKYLDLNTESKSNTQSSYPLKQLEAQAISSIPLSDKEKLGLLELKLKEASAFPKQHLDEIDEKLRSEHKIKPRIYEPLQEIDISKLDSDSITVHYRIIEKNKQRYFQELWIDKSGNYCINKKSEKLESEMIFLEKLRYQTFSFTNQNEQFKQIRNNALGRIDNELDKEKN